VITSLTLSYGTANGVAYLNGSKVLTTGSALTFDGTNLGVGTSSPSALLDIQGATGVIRNTATTGTNQVYTRQGNTGGFFYTGLDTSAGGFLTGSAYAGFLWMSGAYPMIFGTSNAEQMRLTSTGLGIGTSSPQARLSVQYADSAPTSSGTISSGVVFQYSTGGVALNMGTSSGGYAYFNSAYANNAGVAAAYRFYQGATQAMTLDSSGNLLVGTTSSAKGSSGSIISVGVAQENIRLNGSGTQTFITFNLSGTTVGSITATGSVTSYNVTSDQRLKENIQDAKSSSALIDALQVRQFDWKEEGSHQRYGFIAQELVTVAPEAVHQPVNEEEMMAVDYSKLVPMLVKEIQSLRKRLTALESKEIS